MKTLLRALPDDFEIVLADVGSAGGVKDRWAPARSIVSALLFEPRDGGEPRRQGRDTLYPWALGPEPGRATLNITALPNMSSTLRPNRQLMRNFRKKDAHTEITGSLEMPVTTLDRIAEESAKRIDAIKIDTQGSELEILRGATRCLSGSVLLAEVEVSFLERYQGQPLLRDIERFMAEFGFELVDLYRLKRYRRVNASGVGNISLGGGQRAGRLAYGDALFVLEERRLLERIRAEGEGLALKAIVGLLVYGKADLAAALFDQAAETIDARRRERIGRYFRSIRGARRNSLHHLIDYLARNV